MPRLSLTTKRVIAGFELAAILLTVTNYHFALGLLGPYPKHIMTLTVLIAGLLQILFPVTPGEMRAYKKSRNKQDA